MARWRRELSCLVAALAIVATAGWVLADGPPPPLAPEGRGAGATPAEIAPGQGPVSYQLEAVLDADKHDVSASGVIRFRNDARVAVRELWLHAYLNAFASQRTVFMRAPVGGFRGGDRPARWGRLTIERLYARELGRDLWPGADKTTPGDPDDATDLRVPLGAELAPGAALTLETRFTAELPSLVMRTGFAGSFHMVAQWFPKLARLEPDGRWAHFPFHRLSEFYADFGDYDVTVDVPERFAVGATGVLDGAAAVSGGRRRERYTATRVLDFAFAAWDGFARASMTAGDVAGQPRPVELAALYPRGEEATARLELDTAAAGLVYFGARYGAYPYPRLTLVRPPREASEAGGMEYPMLITTGASGRGARLGAHGVELLTAHELAHQWFMGVVASDEYRFALLDEGLATFAELDYGESRWPEASGAAALGLRLSGLAVARAFAAEVEGHGPIARPASEFASGADYAALVYARTATTLFTLGRVYGEDRLRAALARYAREQRFSHPEPDALAAALRAEMGDEPAARLGEAFAGGWVDYAVERGEGEAAVVRRSGNLVFPVDVELWGSGGQRERVRWDGKGDHRIVAWHGAGELVAAVVDPDGRVLLDGDLRNNARRVDPQRIAPRSFAVASWLAGAAMAAGWP